MALHTQQHQPTHQPTHPTTAHQQQSPPPLPLPPPPPPPLANLQPASALPQQPTTPKPPVPPIPSTKRESTGGSSVDSVTDSSLYHQLKKQRRKRGPKWTVQQTNELLDALRAYVVEKGYPSSSEHGKSDEWSIICRQARQDGRFTGYQACNRVSNLRKDFNVYLETTHLRFLSDAQQHAQLIVQQHLPHAALDVQREKEQEVAEYIRKHTKLSADWCSVLHIDEGTDPEPYPYLADINKQLAAAKHKNADLYSYHSRFKAICDAMRANVTAAGEKKRARMKRKTDGDGGQMNGGEGVGVVVGDERESVGMGSRGADGLGGVEHHEVEQSVGDLGDLGDEHAVDDLLPPLADHDEVEPGALGKVGLDDHLMADHTSLQPQHLHHSLHHSSHMDDAQQQQQQQHATLLDQKPASSIAPTSPTTAKGRKRPHSTLDLSNSPQPDSSQQQPGLSVAAEKKKKLTSHDMLAQLHAALLDVEAVQAKGKERIEEAFSSKADWYDKLMLTDEERLRIDPHVRSLEGLFGVTHDMLVACLDTVSVGTWKKMLERYA